MLQGGETLLLEGVELMFRNFEGRETEYNRPGDRNFCAKLPPDMAAHMVREGWNVRPGKIREEGDEPQPYIQVAVGFKIRPPRLVMINSISKNRVILEEDTCEILDWADVLTADLIIRARPWTVRGASGIKAYLKTLYVIIDEDYLDLKYSEENLGNALPQGLDYIDGEIVETKYELEG